MLHEFLFANRAAIIARTRTKVAGRIAPTATEEELTRGVPLFLDQLIDTLRRSETSSAAIGESATLHARDLLERGFTVAQVVYDYGGLCQAVTELADELNAPITAAEFHTFNGCLDDAIAQAVTEYGFQREQSITDEGRVRSSELAHELRNAVGAAVLAFDSITAGTVGLGGSTAMLLGRSLRRLAALIDSSVAQVRLESGVRAPEPIAMRELMDEIAVGAAMQATAAELTLDIATIPLDVSVNADRQFLTAAITNLLQNAFKFTRPRTRVMVRVSTPNERVLVDVEDECGGFERSSTQKHDRAGLGLGLTISRKSIEADGGKIHMRDMPNVGCVFTIDLPRLRDV